MRALIAPVLLLALAGGAAAGCAGPSREREAEELRERLAALPSVTSVHLKYREPIILDSGKVALRVRMTDEARADQVVAVTTTAYDAFRSTHRSEEADLSIAAGRTTVALRAFEPDASVDAVGEATRTGLDAAPHDGSVAIDLTTQDVDEGDHVAGTYVVGLAEGSTAADVPALLDSLAARHEPDPLIGWGAAAADGSSLAYDIGFPPAALVARWSRAQAAGLPLVVRAFADGVLFAEARLTSSHDPTSRADRRALDRMVRPQLRALGRGEWVYDILDARGDYLVSIDRYSCLSTSEGSYDRDLEAWVVERFGACEAPVG